MASLRKHPKSPYWTACFTLPDGSRTTRSTCVPWRGVSADEMVSLQAFLENEILGGKLRIKRPPKSMSAWDARRLAERIAAHFEDVALGARTGRLIESQARKTIGDIYRMANPKAITTATAEQFLKSWLERKELEACEKTHQKYAEVAAQFCEFMGARIRQNIANITAADITGFRDWLAERKSIGTTNGALKIIRSAFGQAFRDGLVDVNEAARVTTLKRHAKTAFERKPFTPEQLRAVLAAADPEWRGMVMFGLYTGQRLGDLATLTWENLDLQKRRLTFTTEKTGRRMPELPIAPPLLRYIEAHIPAGDDPSQPLFPTLCATRLRHKHAGNLSNQFYAILCKAGLAEKKSHKPDPTRKKGRGARREQNPYSFHSLRHTATSWLKAAGVNEATAREFIGHDSPAVSARYTHLDFETLQRAANALPDITQ